MLQMTCVNGFPLISPKEFNNKNLISRDLLLLHNGSYIYILFQEVNKTIYFNFICFASRKCNSISCSAFHSLPMHRRRRCRTLRSGNSAAMKKKCHWFSLCVEKVSFLWIKIFYDTNNRVARLPTLMVVKSFLAIILVFRRTQTLSSHIECNFLHFIVVIAFDVIRQFHDKQFAFIID